MAHIDLNPDLEMLDEDGKENENFPGDNHTKRLKTEKSEAVSSREQSTGPEGSTGSLRGPDRSGGNSESDAVTPKSPALSVPGGATHNGHGGHRYKYSSSVHQLDHSPITLAQQSKLINYVDAQLLAMQRRFVKSQADSSQPYPVENLIRDTLAVVDIIWCSVSTQSKLFGQGEYMVKLLGDLEDYLLHYNLAHAQTQLFAFFHILDERLSTLIDGYTFEGHTEQLGQTLLVRLAPIVTRVRGVVVTKLERERERLVAEVENGVGSGSREKLHQLELDIGTLLEGVMERIE